MNTSLEDYGPDVNVIYHDFRSVFDKVPYDSMISKLVKCAMNGTVIYVENKWVDNHI